jgi:hypothetical protein
MHMISKLAFNLHIHSGTSNSTLHPSPISLMQSYGITCPTSGTSPTCMDDLQEQLGLLGHLGQVDDRSGEFPSGPRYGDYLQKQLTQQI